MKRTRILQIAVAAILVLAGVAAVLIVGRDTLNLDIVYHGSTNNHQVVFTISNRSPIPVAYWVGFPQIKTNSIWPRPHITADDGLMPPPTILAAGENANIVLYPPTSGDEWRLPVFWEVQGERAPSVGISNYNLRILRGWWPVRRYNRFPKLKAHGDRQLHATYSITIMR